MKGKLVFNQSRSTFLSLYRFSKMAVPTAFVEWMHSTRTGTKRDCRTSIDYLLTVKSALVSPATVTGLDWFFAPSCQTIMV